jgi:hypothetical protein
VDVARETCARHALAVVAVAERLLEWDVRHDSDDGELMTGYAPLASCLRAV